MSLTVSIMKQDLTAKIELKLGVTAKLDGSMLTVKGPKGQISRNFLHPRVQIAIDGNKIVLSAMKATKREKTMMGSFESHIANMVHGVGEPYLYKLKICSGHFPMTVSVSAQEVVIKNFLGESVPRRISLPPGVTVKVSGTEITVESADKEIAGQTAAKIENICRITGRDIRIFQDGCYIVQKAGEAV